MDDKCRGCAEWTDMFGCALVMGGQPCPYKARAEKVEAVLRAADEYLSRNPKNSIGFGSLLHQRVREALTR